jgi:hypothetical protein
MSTAIAAVTAKFPATDSFTTLEIKTEGQVEANGFANLPTTVKKVIVGAANAAGTSPINVGDSGGALFSTSVNEITFTGAIGTVGAGTFVGLTGVTLEIVKGGPTAGTIPDNQFQSNNVVTVKLGKDVIDIGTGNFGSSTLKNYVVESTNVKYGTNYDGVLYGKAAANGALDSLIKYPPAKDDAKYEIAPSTKTITGGAFGSNAYLTELTIPEEVNRIEAAAFSGLPATFITVKYNAINATTNTDCFPASLTSITFGEKVTAIPTPFFAAATVGIEKIDIPEGIGYINGNFVTLTGLKEVTFRAKNLASSSLFYNSTGPVAMPTIKKVTIGKNVEIIPATTFKGTDVMELNLGGVVVIGANAFEDCVSLNNVEIPFECTGIADEAFKGCTSLVRLVLPKAGISMGTDCWMPRVGTNTGYLDLKTLYTSAAGGEGVYGFAIVDSGVTEGWWKRP